MIDIIRTPEQREVLHPDQPKQFERLRSSRIWSWKKLEPFRVVNKRLIDFYTGGSYGDGGESGEVPLNMIEQLISIFQRKLASHTPQTLITSSKIALKPTAVELEIATNRLLDLMDIGTRLNEFVINALFGLGIMKVGRTNETNPRPLGFNSEDVNIYAEVIGLEDWVHDGSARRFEEVDYAGHMFNLTVEEVLENPEFSKAGKEAVWSSVRNNSAGNGMQYGDRYDRPETLSNEDGGWSVDDFTDKVNLWETWLPRTGEIVIDFMDHESEPLYIGPYIGQKTGPYTLLGYSPVPGNIMPLSPGSIQEDLADLVNVLFRKTGQQATRARTVMAGKNRAAGDMDKITQTGDGETVLTEHDPREIQEFRFGGVDPGVMGAMMQFKDLFSYQAGNLDAMGGLSALSETIGQDKMLKSASNERLADMQDRTVKATVQIIGNITWHLWNEDSIDLELTKQITPTISRDFRWNRFSRAGDVDKDFEFNIVPYSLLAKSPEERLNTLVMVYNQLIMPNMQMMQAQGITFDFRKFLEYVAKFSNVEELRELLKDDVGQQLNPEQSQAGQGQPASTQRNYTRQNLPSPDSEQNAMMDMMKQAGNGMQQPNNQNMMPGRGRPPAAMSR